MKTTFEDYKKYLKDNPNAEVIPVTQTEFDSFIASLKINKGVRKKVTNWDGAYFESIPLKIIE